MQVGAFGRNDYMPDDDLKIPRRASDEVCPRETASSASESRTSISGSDPAVSTSPRSGSAPMRPCGTVRPAPSTALPATMR